VRTTLSIPETKANVGNAEHRPLHHLLRHLC
jgi:hypothetical protein